VNPKSPKFDPKIRRIDDDNANPVATWVAMGSPAYPTEEQIAKLWIVSEMPVSHVSYSIVSSDEVSFSVAVPPEGVAAITFSLD
jgi:xylan 1,4-beta-xylosidase